MAATENMKLELQSAILEEAIGQRLLDGKREPCEIPCADFDARPGVPFLTVRARSGTRRP